MLVIWFPHLDTPPASTLSQSAMAFIASVLLSGL